LRIAAKNSRGETVYFKKRLEPQIEGRKVQLVGEVDDARKQPFLAEAAALLFPIDWPEPFGLVMIEAMAFGAPVIAYRSAPSPISEQKLEPPVASEIVLGGNDGYGSKRNSESYR